jgi:hypothetical protein
MCFRLQKLILVGSAFCASLLADAISYAKPAFPNQCEAVGKAFGPDSGKNDAALNACFLHVVEQARINRKLYASGGSGKLKVYGFKNLIYIQRDSKLSVISGTMSNLNNIESVALSDDEKTIAVLDGFKSDDGYWRKQILFFESSLNGNVVAFSTNSEKIISYASSISFADKDKIVMSLRYPAYAGRPERHDVVTFDKKGDSRSAAAKNKPESKVLLSSVSNLKIKNPVSVVAKGNQLLVLGEQEVQVFNLDKESYKLANTIKTGSSSAGGTHNHLTLNSNKKLIKLYDNSGNGVEIPY